jgi:parallel beta-helix repeat protein
MQLEHVRGLVVVALIFLLLSITTGYLILTTNHDTASVSQSGDHSILETSYLIWTDNSKVYAKNGLTGTIDYSQADAATVINNAVTATHNRGGGIVFIKSGTYSICSSIIMKSYVTLEGEGWGEQKASTILRLADNVNNDVIKTPQQKNYHITVRNLQIDGNQHHQTAGSGIHIYATDRPTIEHVMIKWCHGRGIFIEGDSNGNVTIAPTIKSVFVWGCGKEGIFVAATDALIQSVDVGHDYLLDGTASALYLYWAHKSIVADSFFWGAEHGIYIDQTNSVLVTGCRVDYNRHDGIVLYCSSNNVIDGNEIVHNSQYSISYADGIYLIGSETIPCANNTISNNFIGEDTTTQQCHRYAINEEAPYCDDNFIIGNNLHCSYSEKIRWNGQHSIVSSNIGYVTENSGTATGTSPIYVAHGLSESPTCVTISVKGETPYQTSWVNLNSTYIAIYHNAGEGIAIKVTWHAEYRP